MWEWSEAGLDAWRVGNVAATTVSIINLKGGVGKSTLTMLLGEYLHFGIRRVSS